jgi:hypothetical protein
VHLYPPSQHLTAAETPCSSGSPTRRSALRPAFEAALTSPSAELALDTIVGDLLEFPALDRNSVLIMQREALAARPSLAIPE